MVDDRNSSMLTDGAAGADRLNRILALSSQTFGDRAKADTWLRRPTSALAGQAPLNLLDTHEGACAVEILLGRIAHGIAV